MIDHNSTIPITSNYDNYSSKYETRKSSSSSASSSGFIVSSNNKTRAGQLIADESTIAEQAGDNNQKSHHHLPPFVCLLATTLIVSILNTFFLAFVVKSIQLNDKGLLNGQLNWDDATKSSAFSLPTKLLFDKSILANSIESDGDKPLRLELISPSKLEQFAQLNEVSPSSSGVFLSTRDQQQLVAPADDDGGGGGGDSNRKFNYLAINSNSQKGDNINDKLEIGTKLLALNLINDDEPKTIANQHHERRLFANNKWLPSTATATGELSNSNSNSNSGYNHQQSWRRLLLFDDEQQSITLPLENKLNLNSLTSNSLIVNELLKSSEITGTLGRNLDVQTRGGNLECRSGGSMQLISKSGETQVTTAKELHLKSGASKFFISSNQLHIHPDGIEYFDSEPFTAPTSTRLLPTQSSEQSHLISDESDELNSKLGAYNLLVANGILMAGA